jgi:hypothetical protein
VPLHLSVVQTFPSSAQAVPLAFLASVGQLEDAPVQVSARSHSPAATLQTTPALPAACWQAADVPLHLSVVQTFPSSVQAVPFGFLPSDGHAADEPLQFSARSHSSAAERQMVADDLNASLGQFKDDPLHISATSQVPAAARQTVPFVNSVHVPSEPARLQAPQPPVHAVSQHTPFTQLPVGHWLADEHPSPNAAS